LPIHFGETPCDNYERVRVIGEDNHAILHDWLDMSEQDIREAEEAGLLK
jgi:crotonobetainyl-CoA:carnitine CoA-transferase CaiB-like acyl-CoA transferase